MWTIKTQSARRKTQAELEPGEPRGHLLSLWVNLVLVNGEQEIAFGFPAETRRVVEDTIKTKLDRLNEQEELAEEINNGTFTLPEPPQPREPSEVENKQAIFERELAEYKEMLELADTLDNLVDQNDLTNKANAVRNARTEYENARRNA